MIIKINQKRCEFEHKMHQKPFGSRMIPAALAGFRGKLERENTLKMESRDRERGQRMQ